MRTRGFTLVEVLIALALFGLMIAMTFAVLSVGARTWEAAEPRAAALDDRLALGRFLRRQLAAALPWSDTGAEAPLVGSAERLRFTAFPPLVIGLRGPQRFEIYRQDGRLWVEVTPPDGEVPPEEEAVRRLVLLDGVEAVRFRYFDGEDWRDRWEDRRLPVLVAVEVRAAGPAWPPWVIALRHVGDRRVGGSEFGMVPISP